MPAPTARSSLAALARPALATALLALAAGCAGKATAPPSPAEPGPPSETELRQMVDRGRERVEAFSGEPFAAPFEVRVLEDRAALDAHWQQAWESPGFRSQCWMVASGTEGELALLSPTVWPEQACEHDPTDHAAIQRLVTHELAHVYHDQHNPRPALQGLEGIAWFVEGLAVHVAGQLEEPDRPTAAEALMDGAAPEALGQAWSGPYRYSLAGSMVAFVDATHGRDTVIAMLPATTEADLLAELGVGEEAFLAAWIAWVTREAARSRDAP